MRLQGANLKFDPVRADEGVFLRGEAGETRLTLYSAIGRQHVDGLVPATVSGPRQVIVRARYTPNGDLREGRYTRVVEQM